MGRSGQPGVARIRRSVTRNDESWRELAFFTCHARGRPHPGPVDRGGRDPVGDRGMLGAADHVRGEQRPDIQAMLTSNRRDIWG